MDSPLKCTFTLLHLHSHSLLEICAAIKFHNSGDTSFAKSFLPLFQNSEITIALSIVVCWGSSTCHYGATPLRNLEDDFWAQILKNKVKFRVKLLIVVWVVIVCDWGIDLGVMLCQNDALNVCLSYVR